MCVCLYCGHSTYLHILYLNEYSAELAFKVYSHIFITLFFKGVKRKGGEREGEKDGEEEGEGQGDIS